MFQCTPWKKRSCCTHNTTRNAHHPGLYNFNYDHCSQKKNMSEECRRHFLQDLCFYECSPNVGPWTVRVGDIQVSLLLCTWAWQLYCIETQYLPSTEASHDRCHACGQNRRDIQNMCMCVWFTSLSLTFLNSFMPAYMFLIFVFYFKFIKSFRYSLFLYPVLYYFCVLGMIVTHWNYVCGGIKSDLILRNDCST